MALTWPSKDPDEVLDYSWTIPVDADDEVADARISVVSGSVAINSDTVVGNQLMVFLSGGADGETTVFLARATTSGGRTFEETISLPVVSSDNAFVSQFLAAFPSFSSAPASSIIFWRDAAARKVGEQYGAEQEHALMLLTAHYLAINGIGVSAAAATLAATGATSFKSGTFSATLSDAVVAQRAKGGYQATPYGQQFAEIQRRLFGMPRLVGGC